MIDLNSIWQSNWAHLIVAIVAGLILRPFIQKGLKKARSFRSHLNQNEGFIAKILSIKLEESLSWLLVAMALIAIVDTLELPGKTPRYLDLALKFVVAYNLIRICYLAAELIGNSIASHGSKTKNSALRDQIAPLTTKTLRVFVIIVGVLVYLQNVGVNVTAILAGLGIGGVAIAFAAQDTVANLFGTITIVFDAPFKIGDRVRVLDIDGNIEDIGFRSTRIRTLYNSVVTLPNSVVAKEKIDNLSLRNLCHRYRFTLGFTYSSPMPKLHQYCTDLTTLLNSDPIVDPVRTVVHVSEFAESSINVIVSYHCKLPHPDLDFQIQHNHLMAVASLAERLQLEFAFPTRTLFLNNVSAGRA